MKNLFIVAALVALAVWAYRSLVPAGASLPADPVTSQIGLDLKVKAQAEMTVRITMLRNSMKQMMAAGAIDPVVGKPVLDDLDHLHADVEDTKHKLLQLGDSPSQVTNWLRTLQWGDFQDTEALFRKMVGT